MATFCPTAIFWLSALVCLLSMMGTQTANALGCGTHQNVTNGQTTNVTLGDRWFLLYIPEDYNTTTPAPLILSYHGGDQTAPDQQALDLLSTPYFNEQHVVVYPNGIDMTWQGVAGAQTDDLGFTTDILDIMEAQYCIDSNRIFATGKSDGGGFVGVLACDKTLSKRVAAFAPVSGAFYIATNSSGACNPETVPYIPDLTPAKKCTPGRTKIPMLEFHGLDDPVIYYDGCQSRKANACLPAIPNWIQGWAARDGLNSTNTTSTVPGSIEKGTAVRYEWGAGSEKGLVTHIMDGATIGHDWPSTKRNGDTKIDHDTTASFNASSIIIDFFAAHPLL